MIAVAVVSLYTLLAVTAYWGTHVFFCLAPTKQARSGRVNDFVLARTYRRGR